MQTTVATLLFVTSAVILSCVVIDYTIAIFEQTLDTQDNSQIDKIRNLEKMILDQTDDLITKIDSLNQTDTQQIEQILP